MRVSRKSGRLRVSRERDKFNPMEGMGNLADVMLVFACGLIVALIFNWNVDVNTNTANTVPDQENKYEIEGVDENSEQVVSEDAALEEMGTVYKDAKTGKYYVVEGGNE